MNNKILINLHLVFFIVLLFVCQYANANTCLNLPVDVLYESQLESKFKPYLKLKFSLNCDNVSKYKVYATYNLFDGLYNNYIKSYYVEFGNKLAVNRCVYPKLVNNKCVFYKTSGAKATITSWNYENESELPPLYKYVVKRKLDSSCNIIEDESEDSNNEFCYFYKDQLVGDFTVNKESLLQEASINNLEFNTTYKFKIALYNNEDTLVDTIELDNDVKFSPTYDANVQDFKDTSFTNVIPKYEVYQNYQEHPNFKLNTKLLSLDRFNNEADGNLLGNIISVLRLEMALQEYGYNAYLGVISRRYGQKPQYIQPEELFIFRNCMLDLDYFNDDNNISKTPKIICNEPDPLISNLIKQKSSCITGEGNVLNCDSPDYGLSLILLAKQKNINFSVNVNRPDNISEVSDNSISYNVSDLLQVNGFYHNEPYLLGLHIRRIITTIIRAYIINNKTDKLKSSLLDIKSDFNKDFQNISILEKYWNNVIGEFNNISNGIIITQAHVQQLLTNIFNTYQEDCNNSILPSSYCNNVNFDNIVNIFLTLIPKIQSAFLPSYQYVKSNCTVSESCVNLDDNSFSSEEICEDFICKDSNEQVTTDCTCKPSSWKWNLYADNDVMTHIANFGVYQLGLIKDFVGESVDITSVINGGEAFSYIPSDLPNYQGTFNDKPYSYFAKKPSTNENEWYNEREAWYTDLSKKFSSQQRIVTSAFSNVLNENIFRKPYIYYLTGQSFPTTQRIKYDYYLYSEETLKAFDLLCRENYFSSVDIASSYLGNINNFFSSKRHLNRGDEYYANYFSTYNDSNNLHLLGRMYGFLKFNYMTGSVGGIVYYHSNKYDDVSLSNLPISTRDTLANSRVHAEFSYLDDFLKNSKLVMSSLSNDETQSSSYLFKDDDGRLIAVARKENDKKHYVVLGISRDFTLRSNEIKIERENDDPINLNIISSPSGNLYEIAYVNNDGTILQDNEDGGELRVKVLDESKTFSLMTSNDDSFEKISSFGIFSPSEITPTFTLTNTVTVTNTFNPTDTATYTSTPTNTLTLTSSYTPTPTETLTFTNTSTLTNTPSVTFTPSFTSTIPYPIKSVIPILNCVFDNSDNTFNAYFGYENPNSDDIDIPACSNEENLKNLINNTNEYCEQISVFHSGAFNGAFFVPFFGGEILTWTLQNISGAPQILSVNSDSTKCAVISPYVHCIDKNSDGTYKAHFGFNNENDFSIIIPEGDKNYLSTDENVPIQSFISGKIDNAFSIDFTDEITWHLNGEIATANKNTIFCDEINCTKTPMDTQKKYLSGDNFVKMLKEQTEALLMEENPFPAIRNIESSAKRRQKRAQDGNTMIKELVENLPDYFLNCDDENKCQLHDNQNIINLLDRKLRKLRRQVGRTIRQRDISENERIKLLIENAKILQEQINMIADIPRFSNDCGH